MSKPVVGKTLKAYTAGMVDGEGSIQINPCTNPYGKKYWGLTIQVSNGDGGVLKKLHEEWGIGTITSWLSRGNKNRINYNWRIYAKEAQYLLENIIPYLRIKKQRAEIALEFKKIRPNKKYLTNEQITSRHKLAMEMRDLNRIFGKGVPSNKTYESVK